MANGDIGIWRQVAGGVNFNSASWTDVDFDTIVEEDGDFGAAAGVDDDKELTAGHVLALYDIKTDDAGLAGSNRSALESGLNLDGADLIYGRGSSYIRRYGGANQFSQAAGAVLDVAGAGDILKVRAKRTDNNLGAPNYRTANASALQVVKLPDTWSYFRATRSSAKLTVGCEYGNPVRWSTLQISAKWEVVDWDAPDEEGAGFSLLGGAGNDEIQVPASKLLVSFGVNFFNNDSDRGSGVLRIQARDGAGAWSYLLGTEAAAFPRYMDSIYDAWATIPGIILDLSAYADPRIRLEFVEERRSGARILSYNSAYITIAELPSDSDYVRLDTDAGITNFTQTFTDTTFDATALELDASSFSRPTDEEVRLLSAGSYLFFGQFSCDRTTVDVDRKVTEIRFRLGGADQAYGRSASFNRGTHGVIGTFISGGGVGFVVKTAASDVDLSLAYGDEATAATNGVRCPTGRMTLQGIALASLSSVVGRTIGLDADVEYSTVAGRAIGLDADLAYSVRTTPTRGDVKLLQRTVDIEGREAGPVTVEEGS